MGVIVRRLALPTTEQHAVLLLRGWSSTGRAGWYVRDASAPCWWMWIEGGV